MQKRKIFLNVCLGSCQFNINVSFVCSLLDTSGCFLIWSNSQKPSLSLGFFPPHFLTVHQRKGLFCHAVSSLSYKTNPPICQRLFLRSSTKKKEKIPQNIKKFCLPAIHHSAPKKPSAISWTHILCSAGTSWFSVSHVLHQLITGLSISGNPDHKHPRGNHSASSADQILSVRLQLIGSQIYTWKALYCTSSAKLIADSQSSISKLSVQHQQIGSLSAKVATILPSPGYRFCVPVAANRKPRGNLLSDHEFAFQ